MNQKDLGGALIQLGNMLLNDNLHKDNESALE